MRRTQDDLKRISNWGYWYELDGVRVVGEWPVTMLVLGHEELVTLRVVPGAVTINDMGHRYEGPNDSIALVIKHEERLEERDGLDYVIRAHEEIIPWSHHDRVIMNERLPGRAMTAGDITFWWDDGEEAPQR